MTRQDIASGMDHSVVADTEVSCIDAAGGRLFVRGQDISVLSQAITFEEMCKLLWNDADETPAVAIDTQAMLASGREQAFALLPTLHAALSLPDAMDAVRAAMCHLRPQGRSNHVRAQITAAISVFAATWNRVRQHQAPVAPRMDLSHAADYLCMAHGRLPSAEQAATLNAYFVTLAEHDLMASTFVARVIASTNADALSSVVGALGALKGSAHGGAIAPVLEMIRAVGTPERAIHWVRAQLNSGQRVIGMGHRVYRTRDPRATALELVLTTLQGAGHSIAALGVARAIEKGMQDALTERGSEKRIAANVELFAAVLLDHLGFAPELFTATYAVSCVAGWLAHYDEQLRAKRLIRPRSRYVGRLASE